MACQEEWKMPYSLDFLDTLDYGIRKVDGFLGAGSGI